MEAAWSCSLVASCGLGISLDFPGEDICCVWSGQCRIQHGYRYELQSTFGAELLQKLLVHLLGKIVI